ncbi:SRPBCC domain-containing protein [Brachybacterium aquaticum]|uniref:Uncharacterized protein YndB with AHSA1/START domain n=1 Tax=Brachybacterium aquaticum TaxID=1432564 RepID=A0A841AFU3_9MICO|nr:SRPBCC domain-containing protein [Brachybacterium aquaticum]MBB5832853.1 uncharacterized protein YndB with AHSA1/START domain [Brachybacterium aquaticum]
MSISGTLDGSDLVLRRVVPAAPAQVWQHAVDPGRLATWYGTWTGDPASGTVEVTMNAEPGEATPSTYTIHACEPERLLTVSSSMGEGSWLLSLELEGGSDGAGGAAGEVTYLALRHHDVPRDMLQNVGPGWEWYLDRFVGSLSGGDVPTMEVWDSHYMPRAGEYEALGS